MAVLIRLDTRLHIPMYFLLSHLSLVDACSSSVISPKMLSDIFVERKVISFLGCAVQLCLFSQFVVTECFLLASMAYDRSNIDEEEHFIQDGDSCQVKGTSGEGFHSSVSGLDLQDGCQDAVLGDGDNQTTEHICCLIEDKKYYLVDPGVSTR
ncbi:hypothetical protein U0070_009655 [Myodes glareolus]|uniref:Uncharacterized protein n=1 Tax=Myodes glareolus TaxID=447135 RepID=A0AAW0H238_MYOGA